MALAALLAAGALAACEGSDPEPTRAQQPRFSNPLEIDNRYWPLEPGGRCELRGESDDGTAERSVKTVLDRTRTFKVDGHPVDVAVVEDRAFEDGELVERTLDYFAQADDGTVYYFGEDVANYENGKLADHGGSWIYGRDTDVLGVAMPPDPKLGDQWRFEDVPGTTVESDRVEEVGMRAEAGGRRYTDVIRVQEFIQPEGDVEYKLYAPGVGVIAEYPPDGTVELVGCSTP